MAAALVAKGSGDSDPRTLEVRLELGGGPEGPMRGLHSDPSGHLCSPQSSLRGGLPASPSPSQLAMRLNSQYLPSFMFPRQEGGAHGGQAGLPNLVHSHGNRGKRASGGLSEVFLSNDRECRGPGLLMGRLPQGLGEEVPPRPSATLLGFLADHQFHQRGDGDCPITRPPALAQDTIAAQRKLLELTHEYHTHERKQNPD